MYVNLNPEETFSNEENQEFCLAILKIAENSILLVRIISRIKYIA